MKTLVTTSNSYKHLIPVFIYLFNKYVGASYEVTILGYESPLCSLPDNFTFVSMGNQGDVSEWSTDIRAYIEANEDDWIWWMMEDSFIKSFDEGLFLTAIAMTQPHIGRIGLTKDIINRQHKKMPAGLLVADLNSNYRLSTQPSLWNREFLLQYLTDGLTPWQFEKQVCNDPQWQIIGFTEPCMLHNEGVRRKDIRALDLNGMCDEDISYIKSITNG